MCIDGAFEIEYNMDLYQYKKDTGANSCNGLLCDNGKASILEIYIS
jgi:mannose-6-phosphate isomerase